MKKVNNKGAGAVAVPNGGYKVGRAIRAREVRLIDQHGKNIGVMLIDKALFMADEAQLELVQLNEGGEGGIPIVKIMDLGRFLYEKKKQESIAKKNQVIVEVKEIKLRPVIGEHDYKIKLTQAAGFLKEGMHVKVTVQFRGREASFAEVSGTEMFRRVTEYLSAALDDGKIEYGKESRGSNLWSRIFSIKGK